MPNFYPFLTYVVVTTFTPGPNNILSMSNALRHGYRKTLRFLAGVTMGFLSVMLISGILNLVLVRVLPQLRSWLTWFGAAYMVYLAIYIAFSRPHQDSAEASGLNTFKAGFALQFVNLKGILYGITVFSLFITPVYQNPVIVSLFALPLAAVAFLAVSSWALGGNVFRNFLKKYERWFNLVMAALLIYIAIASIFPHA